MSHNKPHDEIGKIALAVGMGRIHFERGVEGLFKLGFTYIEAKQYLLFQNVSLRKAIRRDVKARQGVNDGKTI